MSPLKFHMVSVLTPVHGVATGSRAHTTRPGQIPCASPIGSFGGSLGIQFGARLGALESESDLFGIAAVMQHQNRPITASQPVPRGLNVSLQYSGLAYLRVRKEAISRLGVGPVLTCPRNALPYTARELFHQLPKSLVQPHIVKFASRQLHVNSSLASALPLLLHDGDSLAPQPPYK